MHYKLYVVSESPDEETVRALLYPYFQADSADDPRCQWDLWVKNSQLSLHPIEMARFFKERGEIDKLNWIAFAFWYNRREKLDLLTILLEHTNCLRDERGDFGEWLNPRGTWDSANYLGGVFSDQLILKSGEQVNCAQKKDIDFEKNWRPYAGLLKDRWYWFWEREPALEPPVEGISWEPDYT